MGKVEKKMILLKIRTTLIKFLASLSTSLKASSAWTLFTRPFQEDSMSSKKSSGMRGDEVILWSVSSCKYIISPILWETSSQS